ncbi:phenylacetyl-CoA ligase [Pluteus cervinus]|uniref:Phenylacetyl-CoA ligase n=1 Tax=Pluteus cervinus TaxID=181527 RepID=A0ACD3BGF8_9AGAR|nr:phenylacetyl-CoA ligase [Pluteus cervinus]
MTEYHVSPMPFDVPDDLTIPQFILSTDASSTRPTRPSHVPWLVEDASGRGIHFDELKARTSALANALHVKWAIGENDVVCVFSPNDVDYPVAVWAVHTLGAVVTPANPGYTVKELVFQLKATSASLLICHSACLKTAQEAAKEAGLSASRVIVVNRDGGPLSGVHTLEDLVVFGKSQSTSYKERRFVPGEAKKKLAFLSFSSGTTGTPKAVAISHYALIANVLQMAVHNRVADPHWKDKRMVPGDVAMAVLPFFHIYGLVVNLHYSLFCGMSVVVIPKFNFLDFLKSISRHKITHLFVVPPQIVLLCKHPAVRSYDFSHVKYCMSGAAPLSGELMKTVSKVLPNACVGQGYGLTETCTTVTMVPPHQRFATIGSAGQLLPGITARVVKADGTMAKQGEPGELVLTGPSMAMCYYNNDAATKETFINGWVRTGDEVIIKNNEVYVVDRIKEIMKVRGYQVAPAELEGHLLLHEDVLDVCVVGIPDEYSGELPLAFVVPQPKVASKLKCPQETLKLKKRLAKHVADAKVPYKWLAGGVEFIDAIPKNPSGKVLRRILRDQAKTMKREVVYEAKL